MRLCEEDPTTQILAKLDSSTKNLYDNKTHLFYCNGSPSSFLNFLPLPPQKTKISPENQWLENDMSFWNGPFFGDMLIFSVVNLRLLQLWRKCSNVQTNGMGPFIISKNRFEFKLRHTSQHGWGVLWYSMYLFMIFHSYILFGQSFSKQQGKGMKARNT